MTVGWLEFGCLLKADAMPGGCVKVQDPNFLHFSDLLDPQTL
jgi:hypothetical protein